MGIPIVTTFIPLIAISLVMGVVTIVTFTNMHEDQMNLSTTYSVSGVLAYLERNTAGPFFELTSDCRILANDAEATGVKVYRGGNADIYPSGNSAPTPAQLEAFRANHIQMMSTSRTIYGGVYINMYQLYRTGLRAGANPATMNPYDFEWGMSGRFEEEGRHYFDGSSYVAFAMASQWPNFTTTDAVVRTNAPTAGKTPVELIRTLVTANSSWPPPMSRQWWYVGLLPNGEEKLYIMITHAIATDFDAASGFATNGFAIDYNAALFLDAVIRDLTLDRSHWTIISPHTAEIVATTFTSMKDRYIRVVPGDVLSYRLYNIYTCPEERLRNAMKEVDELGPLPTIGMKNHVMKPKGGDIVGVRPLRMAGLDWLIISVTDRGLFFAEGERTSANVIILCSVLLVIAIAVAIATAIVLARPLSDLSDRMALTAELQEDPDELKPSFIREIGSMQMSYKLMKFHLNRMKAYVPQSLMKNPGSDVDDQGFDRSLELSNIGSGSSINPLREKETSVRGAHEEQVKAMRLDPEKLLAAQHNDLTVVDGVVTVVAFGLPEISDPAFNRVLDAHMTVTVALGTKHRGTIREIKPNRVIISFDAASGAASSAIQFGMVLDKAFSKLTDQAPWVLLLDRGTFMAGSCGTESLRQEVLYSATFERTLTLIPLVRGRLGTPFIATERIAPSLHGVTTVPVDCVSWSPGGEPLVLHAVFGRMSVDGATAASLVKSSFALLRRQDFANAIPELQKCAAMLKGNTSRASVRLTPTIERLLSVALSSPRSAYNRIFTGWGSIEGELPLRDEDRVTIGTTRGQGVSGVLDDLTKAIYANSPQFVSKDDDTGGGLLDMASFAANEENDNSEADAIEETVSMIPAGGTIWARGNEIGSGAFGRVFRARSVTGSLAAVKMLPLQKSTVDVDQIQMEVSVASSLHHENLVTYVGTHVSPSTLSIVMELVTGGSLRSHMREFGVLNERVIRRFVMDLVRGVAFLHSKNIVHCDLKPENILVTADGVCKVTDFGSSVNAVTSEMRETDDLRVLGSPQYMAPEVARGDDPLPASDVWSIGIVVCELATGFPPWNAQQAAIKQGMRMLQVVGRLQDDAPPETIRSSPLTNLESMNISHELHDFLGQCLAVDPEKRSTTSMLLSAPFLL